MDKPVAAQGRNGGLRCGGARQVWLGSPGGYGSPGSAYGPCLGCPDCTLENEEGRPEGRPSVADGGEIVSAFPLARNLLGVEGVILDDEIGTLPAALDDVPALSVPFVALGVEGGEGVPLAGCADTVVVQAGLAADVVQSLHLEPPIKGTLT